MFFTFSPFAKINIVVSMSAAGWISEDSNLLLPNFFFFFFVFPIQSDTFNFGLQLSLNC